MDDRKNQMLSLGQTPKGTKPNCQRNKLCLMGYSDLRAWQITIPMFMHPISLL